MTKLPPSPGYGAAGELPNDEEKTQRGDCNVSTLVHSVSFDIRHSDFVISATALSTVRPSGLFHGLLFA